MNSSEDDIKSLVNKIAAEEDADVIFINAPFYSNLRADICRAVESRSTLRSRAYILLVTEGGSAEVAYRICRYLQMAYSELIVVVPGWCKSAGTLFCVGASKIIFGSQGELGPIDVQLRRPDEIGERDSGLAVDSAFDALQRASFKIFEQYMLGVKKRSYGAVTFKTAADIAAQVTVGLTQPILAQLEAVMN